MIFVLTCDEVDYLEMLFKYCTYQGEEGVEPERYIFRLLFINFSLIKADLFKLHGKLDQKSRTETYLKFKQAETGKKYFGVFQNLGILICTDVASRGLDFDDVKLIIQLDAPPTVTDYVNRMGRTARIGHYGLSLLFLTGTELDYVKKLREHSMIDYYIFELIDLQIEKYEEEDYYAYVEGKIKNEFDNENSAHTFLATLIKQVIIASIKLSCSLRIKRLSIE
jgi:ATP-dependent RNA helicase DDX31/DBP7